jgi:hypothetical protein
MPLSTAQKQTLKADIIAASDPECVALEASPANSDLAFAVAALYNLTASPDHWVWRTSATKAEFVNSTSTDSDGSTQRNFIWTGNGFITRSVGEQAAWTELFNGTQSVNPSLANVRQAFLDIFSGTGNAASNRTHLANVGRRKSTRIEKLLATGTGTAATPATMGSEGPLTFQNVLDVMQS